MNRVTKIARNCFDDVRDFFKEKIAKPKGKKEKS
jgi:hypothetical protein